ncbi:MAG: AzlC family ABC transporter permease [Hyphomicrobiales bacterium]
MQSFDWAEFRRGTIDILPVVAVALPIGLLFGTLAAGRGLSAAEAGLMSASVFAGASQFVAIELWKTPAPWALLTLTAFVVNIRHILMGASFARQLGSFPPSTRLPSMFFLADEIWAFSERRALSGPVPPEYYWGMGLALWAQWVVGTILGAIVGTSLGDPATYGLDFAFTAMFICILSSFWRGWRTGAVLLASGVVAAVAKLTIPGAWYIVLGGLAGVAVAYAFGEDETAA